MVRPGDGQNVCAMKACERASCYIDRKKQTTHTNQTTQTKHITQTMTDLVRTEPIVFVWPGLISST